MNFQGEYSFRHVFLFAMVCICLCSLHIVVSLLVWKVSILSDINVMHYSYEFA